MPRAKVQVDRRVTPDPWKDDVDSSLRFLRTGFSKHDTELKLQTKMLADNTITLHGISNKLDDLAPVIAGVKYARTGGRWAKAVALMGSKVTQTILLIGAGGVFLWQLAYGKGWSVAVRTFWEYMAR